MVCKYKDLCISGWRILKHNWIKILRADKILSYLIDEVFWIKLSDGKSGTYPFHPQTIHPWALILSFTSYKFQLYKIIPYSLAYAYHTFSVILYYIDSFHFILYLSSSPFHTFEFIFLMPYYYFSSL